jgi:dolichyl-diphosphooligosaccharide--protein glycosyltransferase
VAEYYLGLRGENWLESLGIDYVTVSYDTLLKFGALLSTAGASSSEYGLIVMPLTSSLGRVLIFSSGPYTLTASQEDGTWNIHVTAFGRTAEPEATFLEEGHHIQRIGGEGKGVYVYVNLNYGYAVIMNAKTFNTPLARLMFTDEYPSNYRLVYSDGGVLKIFRFVHPNVAVTSENGKVALRFENATGTRIGIFGYLDNGTPVFKRWYDVKGKTEFILPENLNGSVVVRYTYAKGRTVLDRGVFRISDVEGKS